MPSNLGDSGLLRRLGISKKTDEHEISGAQASPQSSVIDSNGPTDVVKKEVGTSRGRGIQEVEANQKLNAFEKAHKWDPNLDTDQLDEIDDAVHARDPNAEGRLYDEIFENSPYPEVCVFIFQLYRVLNSINPLWLSKTKISRYEQP